MNMDKILSPKFRAPLTFGAKDSARRALANDIFCQFSCLVCVEKFYQADYLFIVKGHGESTGKYFEGTISKWLGQSLTVFRRYAKNNRQILIGSSLGGWIALRMVKELNKQVFEEF